MHNPKDICSGVIYILFGLAALVIGRDYGMGTALKMGPAYFPSVLGGLLILVGAIAVMRSFFIEGTPLGAFPLKKIALVVASVLFFGFTVRRLGLLVALPLLTIISASASDRFRWAPSLAMAVGLTIFCSLVFLKGLGVPLPLIGSWLAE
jgi:hypothetical protein